MCAINPGLKVVVEDSVHDGGISYVHYIEDLKTHARLKDELDR